VIPKTDHVHHLVKVEATPADDPSKKSVPDNTSGVVKSTTAGTTSTVSGLAKTGDALPLAAIVTALLLLSVAALDASWKKLKIERVEVTHE
jgi:hypothetical protein